MRRSISPALLAVLPLLFAWTSQGWACKGDKVLFDEDFQFHDASWRAADKNFEIKDGFATIKPEIHHGYRALNRGFQFDDVDICVTLSAIEISNPAGAKAGLVFWAKDLSNSYNFLIAANGYFEVGRLIAGAWVTAPIGWTQSDAVKQGVNEPNTLRLTIKGQTLTAEINDKQVVRLRAQAPGTSSMVGIYGESSDTIDTWHFSDLKVTNVK
jgi:hypothetical protein